MNESVSNEFFENVFNESKQKLYHLSFRKKDRSIEKTGEIKRGSYVTNSIDYIKAFDFLNGYGNNLYELKDVVDTKIDNDWLKFKNDYKAGKLITDEFWEYVYWIGFLFTNNIDPFKEKLLIINEPAKVEKVVFNNNLKTIFGKTQPSLYLYPGLISLYIEFGECFTQDKHNGIVIDINGKLYILDIVYYDNRKEYFAYIRANVDTVNWFFLNKPFKVNSKQEVIDKIRKKYKLYFV